MAAKRSIVAAPLLLLLLLASPAAASYTQQGAKLVGTGAVGAAGQGISVAISADGNTAVLGGSGDAFGAGAAWVYTRSAGAWSQQGAKLVGTGAVGPASQGYAIAISGDGNTVALGGRFDGGGAGATWVFTQSAGVWSQQGLKLVGTGAATPGYQGNSVALSGDGNTLLVGGYRDNSTGGAAWVFTRSAGAWSQQGAKLVGTGAMGLAYQGACVAISADGNTAVVGGPADNSNEGATWVFTRSAGVWTQQGGKLVGTGASVALQGGSVAVSGDGNTLVSGGYGDNGYAGAAWMFARNAGAWSQQGAKLVGAGAAGFAYQGISVALSADGNAALVGGYYDSSGVGAAWVYARSAGVWSEPVPKLVGTGAALQAYQGVSVSLSADGNTALVGGYYDNLAVGAAWVFVQTPALGVDDGLSPAFALEGARPNPTMGSGLRVAFELPSAEAGVLELIDVSGRRLLAREVGSLGAGRHTMNLAENHRVPPGLYWVRLAQGANRRVTRVAVTE